MKKAVLFVIFFSLIITACSSLMMNNEKSLTEEFFADKALTYKNYKSEIDNVDGLVSKIGEMVSVREGQMATAILLYKKEIKLDESQLSHSFQALPYLSQNDYEYDLQSVPVLEPKKEKLKALTSRSGKLLEAKEKCGQIHDLIKKVNNNDFKSLAEKKIAIDLIMLELKSLQLLVPVIFEKALKDHGFRPADTLTDEKEPGL